MAEQLHDEFPDANEREAFARASASEFYNSEYHLYCNLYSPRRLDCEVMIDMSLRGGNLDRRSN